MFRQPILLAGNLGTVLACTATRGTVVPAAIQEVVILDTVAARRNLRVLTVATGLVSGGKIVVTAAFGLPHAAPAECK